MRTIIAFLLITSPLLAQEEIKIVLWNSETLFDATTVNSRSSDLAAFGAHFSDADVVILDEVTSIDVLATALIRTRDRAITHYRVAP